MLTLPEEPGKLVLQKSLCAAICGSIGSTQYRQVWIQDGPDRLIDVLEDGNLACAWYVSNLLYVYGLVGAPHTCVDNLIDDLQKTAWGKVAAPEPGCVIVWEPRLGKSGVHRHVGFYVGSGYAVSTSDVARAPAQHIAVDATRKIELVLQHPALHWGTCK